MEMKLQFKTVKAKKKPNGSSSISIFGQAYDSVDISVNEQGLHVAGSKTNSQVKEGTDAIKEILKTVKNRSNN